MFAILGLGFGELAVLILLAVFVGTVGRVLMKAAKGPLGPTVGSDEMRKIRFELDCLREENEQMREEIKRLRDHVGPNADTGIKQS